MTTKQELWNEIIHARRQCDVWDYSKEFSKELLIEILEEAMERVPSKQNRMPYQISILDWSDPEYRNALYEFAVTPNDQDEGGAHNPQVLAPWLLCFRTNRRNKDMLGHVEVGMLASMIIHGAKVRGIDAGFCRCWDRYDAAITERLGLEEDMESFAFFLGLGHGTKEWQQRVTATMENPVTGETIWSGISDLPEYERNPRPRFEDIYRFV